MIWECSHSNEESGRTAAEGVFKREPRRTAILATSDRLAIGVIEPALAHQLGVPEDLAVVGFDDIPAALLDYAAADNRTSTHGREGVFSRINVQPPEYRNRIRSFRF